MNSHNHLEDLSELISAINPNKWKIFKCFHRSRLKSVSDPEYYAFVDRHRVAPILPGAENNDEMVNSYLMIDPLGRFFENGYGEGGHIYSRPLHEVGYSTEVLQWC